MSEEQSKYNKKRLMALGVLILLVLLIIFLLWWWFRPAPSVAPGQQGAAPVGDTVVLQPQNLVLQMPPPPLVQPTAGETEVMILARNFTERYGSFSTDSRFQNLADLFPIVTTNLKAKFERTIASAAPNPTFKGVQTMALNIKIDTMTDTRASATVIAQRVETGADLQEQTTNQTMALTMVKDGQYWYVDTAEWKTQ